MLMRKFWKFRSMMFEMQERLIHIEQKQDEMMHKQYYRKSYAQHGEDVLIFDFFKTWLKIKNPTYIDIGAHHPYEISNTAIFYENGCRGVNIEANPILFENFKHERPNDINICCGIYGGG